MVTPYYNRPSQAGLDAHFRAAAAATDLPIVLYDIPGRTGRKVDTSLLIRLANEVPTIVGLKDAGGNPGETAKVIAGAPDDYGVWSGDDPMTLPLLAVGAVGVIGTATHWCGEVMAELIAAFEKGDHDRAQELNVSLFDSYDYESREIAQFAQSVKTAMRVPGSPPAPVASPSGPEPDGLEDELVRCSRVSASSAEDRPDPAHGSSRHHHLPRRPGRDRSQLHGAGARRPAPPPRLRADVPRASSTSASI